MTTSPVVGNPEYEKTVSSKLIGHRVATKEIILGTERKIRDS